MTLFLQSSEQALKKSGCAEAEAVFAGMDDMVGQHHVQWAQAARDGARQGNVVKAGQRRSMIVAPLDQGDPTAIVSQQMMQQAMPILPQRQQALRSPVVIQNRERQFVLHSRRMPRPLACGQRNMNPFGR